MQFQWKGVFPAMLTPFTAEDEVDIPLFVKNLKAQEEAGVKGIILGGSLGEASTISTEEKEILLKTALQERQGKLAVIMNIAESTTRAAVEQARLAEDWGADGLMLLPPMRYKSDDHETVVYFRTVAESTSLPVMLYNNPVDYKINITLDMLAELESCGNITAIKESTRDVTNVIRIQSRFGDRFSVLCGVDTLCLEELAAGADGLVAGLVCAFPEETVELYELVKSGNLEEARTLYRWFMPLLELDIHPKLVQYIKLAATQTGIGSEYVRAPRLVLEGKERDEILAIIKTALSKRPQLKRVMA